MELKMVRDLVGLAVGFLVGAWANDRYSDRVRVRDRYSERVIVTSSLYCILLSINYSRDSFNIFLILS